MILVRPVGGSHSILALVTEEVDVNTDLVRLERGEERTGPFGLLVGQGFIGSSNAVDVDVLGGLPVGVGCGVFVDIGVGAS